jgi:hypothetical protein
MALWGMPTPPQYLPGRQVDRGLTPSGRVTLGVDRGELGVSEGYRIAVNPLGRATM